MGTSSAAPQHAREVVRLSATNGRRERTSRGGECAWGNCVALFLVHPARGLIFLLPRIHLICYMNLAAPSKILANHSVYVNGDSREVSSSSFSEPSRTTDKAGSTACSEGSKAATRK
jgi:hypothetical protein